MTNERAIKFFEEQHKSPACFISLEEWRDYNDALDLAIEALRKQDQALNEWCTDCKEYDNERHCCPRFNRVIKSALEDIPDTNVGELEPCKEVEHDR